MPCTTALLKSVTHRFRGRQVTCTLFVSHHLLSTADMYTPNLTHLLQVIDMCTGVPAIQIASTGDM